MNTGSRGRRFWKMTGSGNDFVFFDARREPPGALESQESIDRVCARRTGVGADGIVFLQTDDTEAFRIRYFNRDGSLGELCGNASLCSVRLAMELGIGNPEGFRFNTDAGVISARLADGVPEIDLRPAQGLRQEAGIELSSGEERIGFVDSGVPHLVALVQNAGTVDVERRGRSLRNHPSLRDGANVNFVSKGRDGRWRVRTYERGVEAETLACGTGSVATVILLEAWGLGGSQTAVETRSGRTLTVTMRERGGVRSPSLRGEGRIVFAGELWDV
jgi:diaminopimelate epimerase